MADGSTAPSSSHSRARTIPISLPVADSCCTLEPPSDSQSSDILAPTFDLFGGSSIPTPSTDFGGA